MSAEDDRKYMGTPEEARAELIEKARKWREYRQPQIGTKKELDDSDLREREARFQLANAALTWLWHEEHPLPSAPAPEEIAARIELRQTCPAFPEQYDAYLDGQQVGYLRLRNSRFIVECPDCGDTRVLEGEPNGAGRFEDGERDMWLTRAKGAIATHLTALSPELKPCPFCGGNADFVVTHQNGGGRVWSVECRGACDLILNECAKTKERAAEAWNIRADALEPSAPAQAEMEGVIGEIAAERQRQVEAEGWTPEHDDAHGRRELLSAAKSYCLSAGVPGSGDDTSFVDPPIYWPWQRAWWKPKNRHRDLIRAAALIVAEIERLDRLAARPTGGADAE